MDMRVYYRKIHETEQSLLDPSVVVSLETPEGGKAGVATEVSPRNAARLIVEGRARLATQDEARQLKETQIEAKREADQLAIASRMQVTIVPSSELRELKYAKSKG